MLSCQLRLEGYEITALEPVGLGFGHFIELQKIVLYCSNLCGCEPKIMECSSEELMSEENYGFIFSINVMEHISDWKLALKKIKSALVHGGVYHFICPNYNFPYEPHFKIPNLWSKKITEFFCGRYITLANMPDPIGTWESLNWITSSELDSYARELKGVKLEFNNDRFRLLLVRACSNFYFSRRLPYFFRILIMLIVKLRLHHAAQYCPVLIHPTIDCKMTKA